MTSAVIDIDRGLTVEAAMAAEGLFASDPTTALPSTQLSLLIADSDPLSRGAVRRALEGHREFSVAAEAANGVEAVELALEHRPDLVLTEVALGRLDGIEATRRIVEAAPEVRVVVLATDAGQDVQLRALRAGASGFLSKSMDFGAITQALRAVSRGEAAVSRRLTMRVIEQLRRVPESRLGMRPIRSMLTSQEWVVLDLLAEGGTTAQLAETLSLSEATVYSHVKNMMRKLGVHTRGEVIAAADRMREMVLPLPFVSPAAAGGSASGGCGPHSGRPAR